MTSADRGSDGDPPPRAGWLAKDEAERLRRTFGRLVAGEEVEQGLELVAHHAARHPDNPMVRWLAAWGPTVARDWTTGFAPPPVGVAPEGATPPESGLDLVVCFVAGAAGVPADPATGTPPGAATYHRLIGDCFASARVAAPAMRRVLLTNAATDLPDALGADVVVRAAIAPARLMLDRLRAYRDHLATAEGRAGAVFVDPDIVVCRSPAAAFDTPFAVGLTWREGFPAMPVNGGVVFARRTPGALWLLDRALDCYRAIAGDPVIAPAFARLNGTPLESWYGDQVALAALAGWRHRRAPEARRFGPGATLAFLPQDPFNFAVDPTAAPPSAELRRRVLVHFKGNGKQGARRLVADLIAAAPVDAAPAAR